MSSDIWYYDTSEEMTSLEELHEVITRANIKLAETFNTAATVIAQAFISYSDPKSDPIADLEWYSNQYKSRLNNGGIVLGFDPAYIFNDEIQPAKIPAVPVPTDDQGRPRLNATGGMVARQRSDLCPRHRIERVGGYCRRCQ